MENEMASLVIEDRDVDSSTEEDEEGEEEEESSFHSIAPLKKYRPIINTRPPLTKAILRNIRALKQLQLTTIQLEATFYTEVHALECKYLKRLAPLLKKREAIVNGTHEPTPEESIWASDSEDGIDVILGIKEEDSLEFGIPNFWLKIFLNVECLAQLVKPVDVPVLSYLNDVTVASEENPMSFTLIFHFSTNKYFTNAVLTKQYYMKSQLNRYDPFRFEGLKFASCTGCTIDWNEGMNITQRTVKKRQKTKSGMTRVVNKISQIDSFFNFFSPPVDNDDKVEEVEMDFRKLLVTDFEVGQFIRDKIVPKAVLYFTGEALEEASDSDVESDSKEKSSETESDIYD